MGEPAAPEGLSDTISAVRQTIAERLPQLAGSAAKGLVPLALGLGLMSVIRAPETVFLFLASLAPNIISDMLMDMRTGDRKQDVGALADVIADRLDDAGLRQLSDELQIITATAETLQTHGRDLRDAVQTLERELKSADWPVPPHTQAIIADMVAQGHHIAQAKDNAISIVAGPGATVNVAPMRTEVHRRRFLRIIVGSAADLDDERQAVRKAVEELFLKPEDPEPFPVSSLSVSAREACRAMIRDCEIYLGLLGARYGQPVAGGKSITHFEIDTARKLMKPVLLYRQQIPEDEMDENQRALIAHLEESQHRPAVRTFNTLDGLANLCEQVKMDIQALLSGEFDAWVPRPKLRVKPSSGKRGLIASLGRSPGAVTGLYRALRQAGKPIHYVRTISTSEFQVKRAVRTVRDDLKDQGVPDYADTAIHAVDFAKERDVMEFKAAFSALLAQARANGDAVAIGIAGGRTVMGALLTLVAQMEAPADSSFYQLSVPDAIEEDGRYPSFHNQSAQRKKEILRPTEFFKDRCHLIEIPFSRFYDDTQEAN